MATSIPENSVRGKGIYLNLRLITYLTISLIVLGKRLFEKSEERRDEKVLNTLLESNQGILRVLHGMQVNLEMTYKHLCMYFILIYVVVLLRNL